MKKQDLLKHGEKLAFEWKEKDDGSLGHCPECYQQAFTVAVNLLWPAIESLDKIYYEGKTRSGKSAESRIAEKALHDLEKALEGGE